MGYALFKYIHIWFLGFQFLLMAEIQNNINIFICNQDNLLKVLCYVLTTSIFKISIADVFWVGALQSNVLTKLCVIGILFTILFTKNNIFFK